jgi:hypothetical protein
VRSTATTSYRVWLSPLVFFLLSTNAAFLDAAEKVSATIVVKDALTSPNQPATVEASLVRKGVLTSIGLGGEPLEMVVEGKVIASAMTGGDGRAFFTYIPKTPGQLPFQVRIGNSPRVVPTEGQAHLAVWEKRQPILMVEMASLIDEPALRRVPPLGIAFESERKAMSEASDELGKLTQFYYRVIYVVIMAGRGDGAQVSSEVRDWLETHKFPHGHVLTISPDAKALGDKIDELRAAGWKTIKIGIGRSTAFAEAFLQRRLEAVMVPEPPKGVIPRKAKVAKDWKEIRKKL